MRFLVPALAVALTASAALADRVAQNLTSFATVCVAAGVSPGAGTTAEQVVSEARRVLAAAGLQLAGGDCPNAKTQAALFISVNAAPGSGGSQVFLVNAEVLPGDLRAGSYILPVVWNTSTFGSRATAAQDVSGWLPDLNVVLARFLEDWATAHKKP